MKTRPLSFVMILLALLIAACAQAPTPTQAPTPEAVETAEPAVSAAAVLLKMTGLEESRELTLADLQALPTVSGWGGTKSSAGVISPPQQLQGVSVTALADLVGGLQPGMGVSIVAKDGYAMTMSYEQIAEGDFITYDPGTGDENTIEARCRRSSPTSATASRSPLMKTARCACSSSARTMTTSSTATGRSNG